MKLVIDIPQDYYEIIKHDVEHHLSNFRTFEIIGNGIPLDDIDSDETKAYFDGQAYGWEQGRKELIDDVKAEIRRMEYHMIDCDVLVNQEDVLEILGNIDKTESEGE